MTTNHCRISKVRLKCGGAEVRVLETHHSGNPEVINSLIRLLDRARRGDLVAFGYVTVRPDGTVGTAWIDGNDDHFHHLASGALTLAHRMGES